MLVATTIIENGIDLPDANTLVVVGFDVLGCRSFIRCAAEWDGAECGRLFHRA